MLQDLRYALRQMRRAPLLAMAIALTIGFGLGAAAAILAASKAALIEPLPYTEPSRLVHLWETRSGTDERSPTSYPTLLDWRARASDFVGLEGYDGSNLVVGTADAAHMVRGAEVTAGLYRLLGVRVASGRDFLSSEDGATGVAIVSDRLARSDGLAVNQTITVNGAPRVIVGVLPMSFQFALLQDADVFLPIRLDDQRRTSRFNRSINVVGRLQPRVPLRVARADLSAVMSQLSDDFPDALAGRAVTAMTLRDALLGKMKPALTGLLIAVVLLLVIMAANLALLMLTRFVERAPELALRSDLGATRGRILRQLFLESLA